MKVVVIGSNGQLGSDLVKEAEFRSCDVYGLTHSDIKVEDIDLVFNVIKDINPDIILNTAAYHIVPSCENDPKKSFEINSIGALNISSVSNKVGAINVYYSTDYVFDGLKRKPYIETDVANPLNIYGTTKLCGEYFTLNYSTNGVVFRVSGLYGKVPCRAKGGNFISTMVELAREQTEVKVVDDEILTPTSTNDIAYQTFELFDKGKEYIGIYHSTGEGECSWYEFAKVIFETLKLKTPLKPCKSADFKQNINRPSYSVLENQSLKIANLNYMPYWEDSLKTFLKQNYL